MDSFTIFGLSGIGLLIAALCAWAWSDSVVGFFVWLLILGSCFGAVPETDMGKEAIQAVKEVVATAAPGPGPIIPPVESVEPNPGPVIPVTDTPDFGNNSFE